MFINMVHSKFAYLLFLLVLMLFMVAASFTKNSETSAVAVQEGDWIAPSSANKLVSPIKDIVEASKEGKKNFQIQCAICHGEEGKGDGIAGMGLNPRPADLTSSKVQKQSDGALFWKLTNGRPPMASYSGIFTAMQRWQLIAYIRTLSNKK